MRHWLPRMAAKTRRRAEYAETRKRRGQGAVWACGACAQQRTRPEIGARKCVAAFGAGRGVADGNADL